MASFLAAAFGSPDYGSDIANGAISAAIGIALVLSVLIVIIGILYVFQGVFIGIEKISAKRASAKAAKSPVSDSETAAILGAISEYRNESEVKITIKSIKKL